VLDGTRLSGEGAYRVLLGFRDRMGAWRVYCQVAHKSPQAPENAVGIHERVTSLVASLRELAEGAGGGS